MRKLIAILAMLALIAVGTLLVTAFQGQNFGGGSLPTGLGWSLPTFTVSVPGSGSGVLALAGNTSGTATFIAPAVAGTATNPVVVSNAMTVAGIVNTLNGCQGSTCAFVVGAGGLTPGMSVSTGAAYGNTINYTHWYRFYNDINRQLGTTCLAGVQTTSAAQHFHVGVYSISGTTATLIWDCAQMLETTAGQVANTGVAAVAMPVGNYYIASCSDIITAFIPYTLTSTAAAASGATAFAGGGSMPARSIGVNATDVCTANAAALPATATTTNITFVAATTVVQVPYIVSVNP